MSGGVPAVVEQLRQDIAKAQEAGETARANELYQAQLQALAGHDAKIVASQTNNATTPGGIQPWPDEKVNAMLDRLTDSDQLVGKWGGASAENFAIVEAMSRAEPALTAVLDQAAEAYEVAEVDQLYLGAVIAKRLGYRVGASRAVTPAAAGMSREAIAIKRREFNERIELAQSEGNSRLANAIYIELQAWLGSALGNGPIVGRGGRKV